jgi:hypothetical protein
MTTQVNLTPDDMLAAERVALEIEVNRQPELPPYANGENCDICGRGVPRWEFVAVGYATGKTRCACCADPDDPSPDDYQVGRSSGGDIVCRGCGVQVWAPTPQLRDCPDCWPEIWRAMDDTTVTAMQLIAMLNERDGIG